MRRLWVKHTLRWLIVTRGQRPMCPGEGKLRCDVCPPVVMFMSRQYVTVCLVAVCCFVLHQVHQSSQFAGSVPTGHDGSVSVQGHFRGGPLWLDHWLLQQPAHTPQHWYVTLQHLYVYYFTYLDIHSLLFIQLLCVIHWLFFLVVCVFLIVFKCFCMIFMQFLSILCID